MRRISRIVAGSGLILLGIALLPLPGPGLLIIFAGLTVIASEFEWASRIVEWVRAKTARLKPEEERSSDSSSTDD